MNCPNCQHENTPTAKFCLECGTALTVPASPSQPPSLEEQFVTLQQSMPASYWEQVLTQLEGENRLVTVLFADMSRSVQTTADLPPDEAAALISELDDCVRAGKVRHIACSNFYAWQVCEGLWRSDRRGWARFACVQALYNLLSRDAEVELLPLCQKHGLGSSRIVRWPGRCSPASAFRARRRPRAPARPAATGESSRPSGGRRASKLPRRYAPWPKRGGRASPSGPWPGCWQTGSSRARSLVPGRWSSWRITWARWAGA